MTSTPKHVADGIVVTLEYKLRDEEGSLIDVADDQDPLVVLQGAGEILPRLEEALYGMAIGEEKEVVLTPDQAYGQIDPNAITLIPYDAIPPDVEMELGLELYLEDETTGEMIEAYVWEIRSDGVVLNLNHPLAGETLRFDIKITGLRQATPEELDHGHSHGNNHQHH